MQKKFLQQKEEENVERSYQKTWQNWLNRSSVRWRSSSLFANTRKYWSFFLLNKAIGHWLREFCWSVWLNENNTVCAKTAFCGMFPAFLQSVTGRSYCWCLKTILHTFVCLHFPKFLEQNKWIYSYHILEKFFFMACHWNIYAAQINNAITL